MVQIGFNYTACRRPPMRADNAVIGPHRWTATVCNSPDAATAIESTYSSRTSSAHQFLRPYFFLHPDYVPTDGACVIQLFLLKTNFDALRPTLSSLANHAFEPTGAH